ncbi:MAX gene-associated protein [Leptodactylus fuscus]|uniref:MAX gene-associated protein n=1 Tax=Leptodactylus fuscus TaxID=238119 RepID=UPI003F4E5C7F
MEEKTNQIGGTESIHKPPSTAPAFFVILQPSQGDGSKEEGILVANRDVSSVAPVISTGPNNSKSDFFLSSNCTSGEITVTLDNNNMWNEFYRCNTEMVLTKQGRRMFPYCRYWMSGLDPQLKYILVMDITPLDNHRYKWNGKCWEPAGKADPHVLGRVFIHPESPSTGQYWMHQPVSFYKLKLTNNILDQDGHIILHSMHRYLPRLHVVPAEKASEVIQLNGPDVHTFTFPQTEFIAVTAYQNFQITQLKIDCNPFAKGFREGTVTGRPGKDLKDKTSEQELDSSSSKNVDENEDPDRMKKLQELLRMSEYLDGDKENETFATVQDFLRFTKATSELNKILPKLNEEVIERSAEHSPAASLSEVTEQPTVEVKKEPEDNYDYSNSTTMEKVAVKQEPLDAEVTDDYANIDVDYPILEKHFAKFKEDPYLDGPLASNSPTEKANLVPTEQGSMHIEPPAEENKFETPDFKKPIKSEDTLQDLKVHDSTPCTESPPVFPSPTVDSHVGDDFSVKEKRRRICKNKIDEFYATLQTALRTSRGPKRKFPKPSVTPSPGNEGTVAPIQKKRGRPPKPKISKVGRPPKKDNPIEALRLFPDFNPDLEDVDGVLFVAFSSKEALDVHTVKKPTDTVSASVSEAVTELTEEMLKILGMEKQLLIHLKTMKYRQVIHPALQQVGLKLNIVDPAMSIDLRYLGVELPLPYMSSDAKYDDTGLGAQGLPFVSRTGKTTDYTKIKGWRDKFSTESSTASLKIEAGRPESSVKNLSAFCSDELDEYLEKEAKLMGDLKELTPNEPASSISYQFPTKSSSYVRTLDSVLKKQAQVTSSLNTTEQPPVPRKKRKYTRRAPYLKANSKSTPLSSPPIILKEKSTKSHSPEKKYHSVLHVMNKVTESSPLSTTSSSVEYLSHPMVKTEVDQTSPVQHSLVTSMEDNLVRSFQQVQMQSQQIVSKPIGFSKAQMKLMELEEVAVWEGKPRTYITEERAEVSLSTLLTAQASLKNKPIQKSINKRADSCSHEFCRLGCICSSLSSTKPSETHCHHETCMFSCGCLKNKLYIEKDGFEVKASAAAQHEAENDNTSTLGYGHQLAQADHTIQSLDVNQMEEHQEMSLDGLQDGFIKAKKRKHSESIVRTPVRFPIWDTADVADDPEPLCIPEQAEFVEPRILHKGHVQRGRSPGGGKPGRPSTVMQVHTQDPVYMYFDSMMTCARVRTYQRKAPEEKKITDPSICGSDPTVKEHDLKSSKAREQENEANKDDELIDERCKAVDNSAPTKLIEIISDCGCKEDDSKALNITSEHITSRESQSFKLGNFNIELTQENKSGEKSPSSTSCSRVKIAVSEEKELNAAPPKQRPETLKVESVEPPDEEPEDTSADIDTKSHGGKGLPFYTKVIPAGKLTARLKTSEVKEAELIEVNGKNYTKAKLLLGQMGALHPANRLAAYITHRLQPNLLQLSKVQEVSDKMATESPSSDPTTEDKANDIVTSQQNKTGDAAQSKPSSMLTQSVMGKVGSLQKSPGVSSPEPAIPVSPKQSTPPTRLIFISSAVAAGKQAPAITTSVNMASLSTTSLSTSGLCTVSSTKTKATSSLPTLMRITKVITKGSSLSAPAGIVAANDARAMTFTSVPSTKDIILTPPKLSPAVVKSTATPGNASSVSVSNSPGSKNSITTPLPSLLVSPNAPRLGSVASQVGLNITSPLKVKTVTTSSLSSSPPKVTSGFEKRLGPRLLLIPVNSASAPSRPVQSVATSPGQKMVLQPIKSSTGVTLFRHPNGQIIQLVPLQQVNSASVQPRKQQVVIRNPGTIMGVRLPMLSKPQSIATTSIPIPATTVPAAPAVSPVVSPSNTSSNKSGVTVIQQTPPKLSQFATSPTSNCEATLALPKSAVYTGSGHSVIASNVKILQSEDLTLASVSPTLQNAATNPNITLMANDPGNLRDVKNQDKMSDSPSTLLPSALRRENSFKNFKEGQLMVAIVKEDYQAEVQSSAEPPTEDVTPEINSLPKKVQHQNGQQAIKPPQLRIDSMDDFLASDEDLSKEARKKDDKGLLKGIDQGLEDKGDRLPTPTDKNTSSQEKIGDRSPVTSVSSSVPEQVAPGEDRKKPCHTGEKPLKKKLQVSASSSSQNDRESLEVDILNNLPTDDESDIDESVDIETVEEFSERLNLARLKASAANNDLNKDRCGTRGKYSRGRRRGSKANREDPSALGDDESHVYHRKNHTANERKRRSELRDLFEELKNALGLHNLPKVSKSYMLKQAIEEIEDLTDTADTLTKKKNLLFQTQSQLIKKMSNLSGKPKEVVQKKLEYLYAKQKAMEAEMKKKSLEEDDAALHKASLNVTLPNRDAVKVEGESNETLSSKTKKPIILARKALLISKEGQQQLPGVSLTTSSVLMAPTGQVGTQENKVERQAASIPPAIIQADLSPAQLKSGMTSVIIQLPSTVVLKDIIGNSPVPISLSNVPSNLSTPAPSISVSENDDLSMMPKIVNVTSLAQEMNSNLDKDFGTDTPDTEIKDKCAAYSSIAESYAAAESCMSSSSFPVNKTKDSLTDPASESCVPYSSLLENVPQENDSSDTQASSKTVTMSNTSPSKMVDEIRDSGLDLDLKKLTSAIDEAGLDPSELSDALGDPEDSDETLTSLLNELAFLNQQLNNDTEDLDSVSDFPGSDSASHSSGNKLEVADSSSSPLGRFKEVPETKEKSHSFSPLFMQLEEGEIPDCSKHKEERGIVVFEGGAIKEPPLTSLVGTQSGFQNLPSTALTSQKNVRPVTPCSDAFWRPMPKLAPLGLKSQTLPSEQVLASKPMPSLASVAMRLSSPKD